MHPELEEILWCHRLDHIDLLYKHAFDRVHAVEQVPRPMGLPVEDEFTDRSQFKDELLEPQFVNLMNDDE